MSTCVEPTMFVPHHIPHEVSYITAEAFWEIYGQYFFKTGSLGSSASIQCVEGKRANTWRGIFENGSDGARSTLAESEAILR